VPIIVDPRRGGKRLGDCPPANSPNVCHCFCEAVAHVAIASVVFFAGCIWFLGYAVFIAADVSKLTRWFAHVITLAYGRP